MKNTIIATFLSLFLASCTKEQVPAGLQLTGGGIQIGDTSYVASVVPITQSRNVLVEEFTGVRCPNCPVASTALKAIQSSTPNRIFAVKFHSGGLAIPILETDPDLRSQQAADIDNALGGSAPGQPSAVINRILNAATGKYSNSYLSGVWPTLINQELAKPPIINLSLAKSLVGQEIQTVCEMTFTDTTSEPLSYCLYLTESKVKATQDSAYVTINGPQLEKIKEYKHEEIFRFSPTPAFVGSNLPAVLQEKGRTYVRVIKFTKPTNVINLANCHLILFVQNANTKKVLQAAEIPL
jgi:Outer membrane protein Omp28